MKPAARESASGGVAGEARDGTVASCGTVDARSRFRAEDLPDEVGALPDGHAADVGDLHGSAVGDERSDGDGPDPADAGDDPSGDVFEGGVFERGVFEGGAAGRGAAEDGDPDDDPLAPGADDAEDDDSGAASAPMLGLAVEELRKAIEAVLFASCDPIPIRSLADLFGATVHDVREAVEELRFEYLDTGRSFRLEEVAGGVQLLTLPAYDVWIRKLRQSEQRFKLSGAAFETLAVIAYKQPITKADLEAIRGVQCGPVLKNLLDRGLIKVAGRDESLGRPLLYGTTARFLESFGIANIRDLPQPELDPKGRAAAD